MKYVIALVALLSLCEGVKPKKKKSEYTQADWDRVVREYEREDIEEDDKELRKSRKGLKFDPNGDADFMFSQAKQGKPTMIFFTLREKDCPNPKALEKVSTRFASMLLNGHVPVQNYPVGERRSIFMTKDGGQSMEIKNFLLAQPEVETVSIDNRIYTPESGKNPLDPDSPKLKKILYDASGGDLDNDSELRKAPDFEHDGDTGMVDMDKYKDLKNPPKILSDDEIMDDQEGTDIMEKEEAVKSPQTNRPKTVSPAHDNRPNIQTKASQSSNDIPEIRSEL